MPFRYGFEEQACFYYVHLSGPVNGAELLHAIRLVRSDPRWTRRLHAVWDGTSITELDLTPDTMTPLLDAVHALPAAGTRGKTAMVAQREVTSLMAHFFRLMLRRSEREMRVVGSVREALEWIGVSNLPALSPVVTKRSPGGGRDG